MCFRVAIVLALSTLEKDNSIDIVADKLCCWVFLFDAAKAAKLSRSIVSVRGRNRFKNFKA